MLKLLLFYVWIKIIIFNAFRYTDYQRYHKNIRIYCFLSEQNLNTVRFKNKKLNSKIDPRSIFLFWLSNVRINKGLLYLFFLFLGKIIIFYNDMFCWISTCLKLYWSILDYLIIWGANFFLTKTLKIFLTKYSKKIFSYTTSRSNEKEILDKKWQVC